MSVTERGPDGAEIDPFSRVIRYQAIYHPLPSDVREELQRIGLECRKPHKAPELRAWRHKLADLLAKMRAEHSTAVERQVVGQWVPE